MRKVRNPFLILVALMFVAALVARAALPTGWMPAQSNGVIRVMLCSGKGAIELPVRPANDDSGHSGKGQGDRTPHDPCPFGTALGKAFDLPSPVVVDTIRLVVPPESGPEQVVARLVAARGIRPPARGPPAFA